jgi:hypothetical protein
MAASAVRPFITSSRLFDSETSLSSDNEKRRPVDLARDRRSRRSTRSSKVMRRSFHRGDGRGLRRRELAPRYQGLAAKVAPLLDHYRQRRTARPVRRLRHRTRRRRLRDDNHAVNQRFSEIILKRLRPTSAPRNAAATRIRRFAVQKPSILRLNMWWTGDSNDRQSSHFSRRVRWSCSVELSCR